MLLLNALLWDMSLSGKFHRLDLVWPLLLSVGMFSVLES